MSFIIKVASIFYPVQFGEGCKSLQAFGPATVNGYLFHYILEGNGTSTWPERKSRHSAKCFGQRFLNSTSFAGYQADLNTPWTLSWIDLTA